MNITAFSGCVNYRTEINASAIPGVTTILVVSGPAEYERVNLPGCVIGDESPVAVQVKALLVGIIEVLG